MDRQLEEILSERADRFQRHLSAIGPLGWQYVDDYSGSGGQWSRWWHADTDSHLTIYIDGRVRTQGDAEVCARATAALGVYQGARVRPRKLTDDELGRMLLEADRYRYPGLNWDDLSVEEKAGFIAPAVLFSTRLLESLGLLPDLRAEDDVAPNI